MRRLFVVLGLTASLVRAEGLRVPQETRQDRFCGGFCSSCRDIEEVGKQKLTGHYWIDPNLDGTPMLVYCDMQLPGGGWTVIVGPDNTVRHFSSTYRTVSGEDKATFTADQAVQTHAVPSIAPGEACADFGGNDHTGVCVDIPGEMRSLTFSAVAWELNGACGADRMGVDLIDEKDLVLPGLEDALGPTDGQPELRNLPGATRGLSRVQLRDGKVRELLGKHGGDCEKRLVLLAVR